MNATVMVAAAVAVGLGLAGLMWMMLHPRNGSVDPETRLATYTGGFAAETTPTERKDASEVLAQARTAAAGVLQRNASLEARITRKLETAGAALKPAEWLLLHVGIAVGVTAFGFLIGAGNIVIALIFLAIGVAIPWAYLGMRAGSRRRKFHAALPDILQVVSGSLSAGLSLVHAIDTVVRDGPEPIASEFKRVLVENRLGVDLEDSLEGVADRFDSRDFHWIVMAIRIQRQVGGNLAELLNTVGSTMRERQYLRRQVDALAAEGKMSAWVLTALPPLVLGFVLLTNRAYVMPLFTEPRGLVILIGAFGWLGVGMFWMSRLVKVEV